MGHGKHLYQQLPKKVEVFADQRFVAASAGYFYSLALTADGSLWSLDEATASPSLPTVLFLPVSRAHVAA